MKKILVTGFEPFGGQRVNPSQMILPEIKKVFKEVNTLTLPVSFLRAFEEFQIHWQKNASYDGVLMLGQAAGRTAISLERVAVNWMQNEYLDDNDNSVAPGKIDEKAPDAFIVDLPLDDWKNKLPGGKVAVSLSAGAYVCNYLYYRVINEITRSEIPALFVHLPIITEQLADKPDFPAMDFELQKAILFDLIPLMMAE